MLVGQTDAEEHARRAEFLLERRHDRNRSAFAREHGALAEALLDRAARRLDEPVVEVGHPRLAAVHPGHLQFDRRRRDLPHVLFEKSRNLVRILVRHQAHAHLRHRGRRDYRLGPFAGEAGQQPVHVEGRSRPRSLEAAVARLAVQPRRAQFLPVLLLVERQPLEFLALLLGERPHIVVEPWNLDAAAAILHLRQHLRQHHRGVRHRAAERSGVQVGRRAAQVDLEVHEAAQAVADRRHAAGEHRCVRDDDDVASEPALLVPDESAQVLAADLLLALDHHLDVDRQPPVRLHVRFDGLQMHEHLALVVGSSAREEIAVAHRRLERRRGPLLDRIHRLHVVVAVDEDRRRTRSAEPLAVHDWMPWRLGQVHVLQPDLAHLGRRPLGTAPHVVAMLGERAHAGNGQVGRQLLQEAFPVRVDEVDHFVHGALPFKRPAQYNGLSLPRREPSRVRPARSRKPGPTPWGHGLAPGRLVLGRLAAGDDQTPVVVEVS